MSWFLRIFYENFLIFPRSRHSDNVVCIHAALQMSPNWSRCITPYHSLTRCLYAFRISCRVACFDTPNILYGSPKESPATTDGVDWRITRRLNSKNAYLINRVILLFHVTSWWNCRLLVDAWVIKKSINNIIRDAVIISTGLSPFMHERVIRDYILRGYINCYLFASNYRSLVCSSHSELAGIFCADHHPLIVTWGVDSYRRLVSHLPQTHKIHSRNPDRSINCWYHRWYKKIDS